jgi:hypothetical protein
MDGMDSMDTMDGVDRRTGLRGFWFGFWLFKGVGVGYTMAMERVAAAAGAAVKIGSR